MATRSTREYKRVQLSNTYLLNLVQASRRDTNVICPRSFLLILTMTYRQSSDIRQSSVYYDTSCSECPIESRKNKLVVKAKSNQKIDLELWRSRAKQPKYTTKINSSRLCHALFMAAH
jgi:hypothetical protein